MDRYQVMVDDNFHYMDESERRSAGRFATEAEAVAACERIVEDSLRHLLSPGMTADELLASYVMFGEDPFVLAPEGAARVGFSARTHARERATALLLNTQRRDQ